jgi:F-type H+-transporting ATPase subunit gamma
MANPRALDKRRKSVRNIKKITRTMELIATARFKKAMDRAAAATAYTNRITKVVSDLASGGLDVSHPLLEQRPEVKNARLLVLTANRGLCGGYNGNAIRLGAVTKKQLDEICPNTNMDVSGKRGINGYKFRSMKVDQQFLQFDDQPKYTEVETIANVYLQQFIAGELDRLDVVYTQFHTIARQNVVVETLLPLGSLAAEAGKTESTDDKKKGGSIYEFVPSAVSILEEVVPTSFKVKLFKCFLDAAVSEQIARMVAMKSATENANEMIRSLSMTYNRARQSKITGEIMEVIGGVNALEN